MSSRVVIDPSGDLVLQIPISAPTPSKETRRGSVDSAIGSSSPIIPSGQCSPLHEISGATAKIDDNANDEKQSSETRELLVSSKILAVSSPVFRTMLFGGKFVEAIKLADAGDGSTTTLTLPDDDAEAVTLMCKILHFATADINDLPKSDLLERLAATCDKYLCLHILRYCGTIWVRNWVKKCEEDNAGIFDVCRLLVFAYVADMEKEFADIVWTLLLLHKGPLSRSTSDATESLDNPLLPLHIRGKLDAKRMQLCNQYHTALMRPLATWGWRSLTKGCNRGAAPLGEYSAEIYKLGLATYDLEFSQHAFRRLLEAPSRMSPIEVGLCARKMPQRGECPCRGEETGSLNQPLLDAVKEIGEKKLWYGCLACLKLDDYEAECSTCCPRPDPVPGTMAS